jgi:peptide/nickel transport system permease protein
LSKVEDGHQGIRRDIAPLVSELKYALYLLRLNKLVFTGAVLALSVVVIGFAGPYFVPPGTNVNLNIVAGEKAILGDSQISWAHPLGVDPFGRDMLGMIILGLGLDLSASVSVVGVGIIIGVLIGSFAGYSGGKIDEIFMRITDIFLAFPFLILALAVAAALGRSLNNLVLALIIVSWPGYTRLIRGQVIIEKEKPYVEGLRALGVSKIRLIVRHIIPNSIFPILVQATLDIGGVILTFAGLSFLGFSVDYFTPELGRMVLDGQNYIQSNPLLIIFPGLVILITSLSFNLLGDGLRDILDPRLRR